MNYKESLDYIQKVEWFGSNPGLSRVEALLEELGNPQKELKYLHITGTNGKGSASAMLASVMKACGYKTGLFTSPYLYRFNERMQINGHQIDDDVLADIVTRLQPIADKMEEHPTVFELMTACALVWFAEQKCDIVVFEVGMGGRDDATNVIPAPEAAVIMNIGLDHMSVLGNTVEEIAAVKADIIKEGCECVSYQQVPSVQKIIEEKCRAANAPLTFADFSKIAVEFDEIEGQVFTYKEDPYAIPLLGEHQRKNAAVVLETVNALRRKGWEMDPSDVEHGLYAVGWPGRFEVLADDPYFVVDGGHNPQCAETVANNLQYYFYNSKKVLLVGVLADKDYEKMAEILAPSADEFICVAPNSPRALSAPKLAEVFGKFGKPVSVCENIRDGVAAAVDAANRLDGMACAVGSLYMVGEIRACFNLY